MFLDSKLDFDEHIKGVFDKTSKSIGLIGSFQKKLETIQYNAALAITGVIRRTSREKVYSELGLESLQDRRWYRKLCIFYKILNNMSPKYQKIFFKK